MGVTRQPSSQTRSEATMDEDSAAPLEGAIRVDEKQLRGHIDEAVRSSVEETLNALLDAEAEQICRIQRSEEHTSELQSLVYLVCGLLFEINYHQVRDRS